jgi:predicted O-methyltransferase YrrM
MLLAQARGARRILKIGALGAYSTIWLARGLAEGGSLITLEADPKHAKIARANIAASGYDMVVKLRGSRQQQPCATCARRCGPIRSHLHRRRQT